MFAFRLVTYCLLVVAATHYSTVVALEGKLRSPSQANDTNFRLASDTGSVKVPFELFSNAILLRFRINNSRPIWFAFDTGASINIINESVARKLGLAKSGNATIEGGGGSSSGFFITDAMISLPGVEAYHQRAAAIPLDQLSAYEGREMGGLIGNPFIMNFVVEIDYASRTLIFYDRKAHNLERESDAVPLVPRDGLPFVKVDMSLNGQETISDLFMIDTGSNMIFHVNRPFAEAHHLLETLSGANIVETVGEGTGGRTRFKAARIDSLGLGGYTVKRPIISISEDKEGIGGSQYPGIIGADLLRRFTLVVDYQAQRILLKPNQHLNEPFEIDMSGLGLMTRADDFKVIRIKHVRPHSPADEAGLREGDQIEEVNHRPATQFNLDNLSKMFMQSGKEYVLTIRRGDRTFHAKLIMKRAL